MRLHPQAGTERALEPFPHEARPPVMELWGVRTGVRFGGAFHAPNPPSVVTLTHTPPRHPFTCRRVQV